MSRGQDLDRNERASPHKLEEAKKRGSAAKSNDLSSLAVIVVATVACFALAVPAVRDMAKLLAHGLSVSVQVGNAPSTVAVEVGSQLVAALKVLAPLLFGVVVAIVLVGLLQSGGIFSSAPLKPDLSRINPVAGFKRFFSVRLLYEAVKSTLKLTVLAAVTYLALKTLLPGVSKLLTLPARALLFAVIDAAGGIAAKICAALAGFALIDLVFSRWDFMRSMRMSRRELEDEHKHREGDPRIKNRLRELRLQFLQRTRSIANVPKADVLIVNPTRIAVALRYEHGKSPAPQVMAKGAGRLAGRMRDLAFRSRVPIVHSPVLARALFKEVAHEAYVPERWYPQVAKILVWVQAARKPGADAGVGR
jgi:flagellar biosynthesis protein FlhB